MFRRKSKLDGNPPKPPTKTEILEDLETFNTNHMNRTRRKDSNFLGELSTFDASKSVLDSTKITKRDRKESGSEQQLEEWWDKFEKFLDDIEKLETYQKQFETKKMNLAKLDETIGLMADDIQTRINDSLGKALAEIPDTDDHDLK
ncbi:uncharacterized protein LOC116343622 [Contarinia nasturtii]|uniref:uncharacterized protein LOC116343622 n=1 Tax=Contarinia nasturtii TaxID=265458 RepID=UPI0012D3F575|nr:uncharacterized protein LOC116343622 [Contarinia nasturtii]